MRKNIHESIKEYRETVALFVENITGLIGVIFQPWRLIG